MKCARCAESPLEFENLYRFNGETEWICEDCFMNWAKANYPDICFELCFVATSIADSLNVDYRKQQYFVNT